MLEKFKNQKVQIIAASVIILGATFGFGVWYGYTNRPAVQKVFNVSGQTPPPEYQNVDFNTFWDVWSRLEDKYVDKGKLDRKNMVYGAVEGLVSSLKDPYTEFLPPQEAKQFKEDISGSFEGIGAEIGMRKGVLTVIAPLKGSPAELAGIKAADKILKINETSTADLNLNEAVRLIRGKKGTDVHLTIFRDGFDKTKEVKIIRDTVKVQIVTTEKKLDGVFVIKLSTFTENAAHEFRKAVQEFLDSGSKKIILDLRNNPGGYLVVSVDIGSWFIPAGEIIARERHFDGSEEVFRSSGYELLENVPVVILVNEGSASASEILAGALRDHKGTKLIGTKTFGKGSVQEVENLSGGASLKITIAKWLTPKGTEINGKGLEPDIAVTEELNAVEGAPVADRALEKALEIIKGM